MREGLTLTKLQQAWQIIKEYQREPTLEEVQEMYECLASVKFPFSLEDE